MARRDATRALALWTAFALLAPAVKADPYIRVRLKIDPPQAIRAVTLRAGGKSFPCSVREGVLLVPAGLPLPWTVGMARFDPTQYGKVDLDRNAPLLLREKGELRFRLQPSPPVGEAVGVYLLKAGDTSSAEYSVTGNGRGLLAMPLSAGIYTAAFVGKSRATRIRSGIVVRPGEITDVGVLPFQTSGSVILRVVDGKTGRPVRGAAVMWSPPDALNAGVARLLFRRVWSATTDRGGIAIIPIGPPPLVGRWTVQAAGYTTTPTSRVILANAQRVTAPDTILRQEATLIVEVFLPRAADQFKNASLVLAEPESEDALIFKPRFRQPLREGENKLKLTGFGEKRLLIEAADGKTLFFQNVNVSGSDQRIMVTPTPCEIRGTVSRGGESVEGSLVTAADQHDAHTILAQTRTDANGRYSLSIFQTGEVLFYASAHVQGGTPAQPILKTVTLAGDSEVRIDFDLPVAGADILVVDAETSAPLHAQLRGYLGYGGGRTRGLVLETDAAGHAKIADAPEGRATLDVLSDGYRAQEITVDLRSDIPSLTVQLNKGGGVSGHVLDTDGSPIAGAQILGGFVSPLAMQGEYSAITDASGSFELKNLPAPEVIAYVIAPGHALGVALLREDGQNEIQLSPPNPGAITLLVDNAPPKNLSLFFAAPAAGAIIPYGVLYQLGASNGMTPFQLLSTGVDGRLILPEFLAAGDYTLYLVSAPRGPIDAQYRKVADLRVPEPVGTVVALPK